MPPSGLLPTLDPAVDEQAQVSVLKTLLATAQHFFGNFIHLFTGVSDPRQPQRIIYPLAALLREHCTACVRWHPNVCRSLGHSAANRPAVPGQCAVGQ